MEVATNNLNSFAIGACLNGKRIHHKKWKFRYLINEEIEEIENDLFKNKRRLLRQGVI